MIARAQVKFGQWNTHCLVSNRQNQNRTADRKSDVGFRITNPNFLFKFNSNHSSISLSFGDILLSNDVTHRRTDKVDHYYSWSPQCGQSANKHVTHVFVCGQRWYPATSCTVGLTVAAAALMSCVEPASWLDSCMAGGSISIRSLPPSNTTSNSTAVLYGYWRRSDQRS